MPPFRGRWVVLAAAVVVEAASGMFYAFGLYSQRMKDQFGLTATQVDLYGSFGNIGGNFGMHLGFFYRRFGPPATMALAAVLGCAGWAMLWASFAIDGWPAPFWLLLILGFLQGQAQMTSDCAVIPTVVASFPEHRGRAVGFAKATAHPRAPPAHALVVTYAFAIAAGLRRPLWFAQHADLPGTLRVCCYMTL